MQTQCGETKLAGTRPCFELHTIPVEPLELHSGVPFSLQTASARAQ